MQTSSILPTATTIHITSLAHTMQLATHIAHVCTAPCVMYLQGELGTGKTTLVRNILNTMGVTGRVKSPTFTLVEPYTLPQYTLYHFDLYRIVDPNELINIGIDDYCTTDSICLIEWPEKGNNYIPMPDFTCAIEYAEQSNQQRHITLSAQSPIGTILFNQVIQAWEQTLS